MNKNDKPKKEKEKSNQKTNINNTLNATPKIQTINANNNNQFSKQTSQKKEENEPTTNKINKPIDLKELDALIHFEKNIKNYENNCQDPITESSYYCFTCKQSICNKCGLDYHKEHILIQRKNCLDYDKSFFNEISKVIEDSLLIEDKKNNIKNKISNSINELKNSLDNLKIIKFKEIDNIFIKLKMNLLELKNNFIKTKKNIEDYYSTNKDFFNIYFEKSNNNNIDLNTGTASNIDISYNDNCKNINNTNDLILKNKDIENTIFILNFDLMNLCDNQNLKILDCINNIKNKIKLHLDEIDKRTSLIQNNILHYLDIPLEIGITEEFYKDINSRISKYSDYFNQFKEAVYEIIKKTSNIDKIKDIINI